jgi:hypothetical protein
VVSVIILTKPLDIGIYICMCNSVFFFKNIPISSGFRQNYDGNHLIYIYIYVCVTHFGSHVTSLLPNLIQSVSHRRCVVFPTENPDPRREISWLPPQTGAAHGATRAPAVPPP